jgi:hypothetical protein
MKKALVAAVALLSISAHAGQIWAPVSISVPTMGEFAIAALAVALGIVGARFFKRK